LKTSDPTSAQIVDAARHKNTFSHPAWTLALKQIFDVMVSLMVLVVIWPLFVMVAVAVKLSSPGPVFYRGIRSGLYGKPFRIYKFRTMVMDAEKLGGHSTALNDSRLTPIGKFLRKYKLDELPQLFNIILGQMSFVGPRPQVENYTKLYSDEEKMILTVKPGLTDYASIRFINLDAILGNGNIDEKYFREIEPEKNRLRIKYAREHNFWIDLKIIFMTFVQLFRIKSLWSIKN
jgi:lipopolysaccharide/colanic/teichoic acid biosynthesis glycosyltransferase